MNEPTPIDPMLATAIQRYTAELATFTAEVSRLRRLDASRATPFLFEASAVFARVDPTRAETEPLAYAAELDGLTSRMTALLVGVRDAIGSVN